MKRLMNRSPLRHGFLLIPLVLIVTANVAMADQNLSFRVQLRPHVFADVVSTVATNPSFPTGGMTVLTVHGFAHTGSTFGNLTQAIFNSPQYGSSVSNVVSVNLPGHGLSSGPIPQDGGQLKYGELSIEDYATAVTETIRRLDALQLRPQVVIAHSMGALVMTVAQQALISRQQSLGVNFGVQKVVLMNAVSPSPAPFFLADSGIGPVIVAPFVLSDPVRGLYVHIPAPNWLGFFFTNFLGDFVPGTPSPQEAMSRGYISDEPFQAGAQVVAAAGRQRPTVSEGIFLPSLQTSVVVVSTEQDILTVPSELQTLYSFLTDDENLSGFRFISGADAVHDTYISNPNALLNAIFGN